MRTATSKEFATARSRATDTRYMQAGRCWDVYYSVRGVEVCSKHEIKRRGKVVSTSYTVNPVYLNKGSTS